MHSNVVLRCVQQSASQLFLQSFVWRRLFWHKAASRILRHSRAKLFRVRPPLENAASCHLSRLIAALERPLPFAA